MKIKCTTAQEAEEPRDYSSFDTTFNGMVVNEAWELRYFSPLNQHQVKKKSQFYNWKRSEFFFKACIHLPFLSQCFRKNCGSEEELKSPWEPWAESGLQGLGGPVVSLWEITWLGQSWASQMADLELRLEIVKVETKSQNEYESMQNIKAHKILK